MNTRNYMMPLIAAVLLAGLGIYYFLFERMSYWWILLLGGAVLNMYFAWKFKSQEDQDS